MLNTWNIIDSLRQEKIDSFELICYRIYGLKREFFSSNMYNVYDLKDEHLCIIAYLREFNIGGTVSMKISEVGEGFKLKPVESRLFDAGTYMFIIYHGKEKQREQEFTSLISITIGEEFIHKYCFNIQVMNKGYVQTTPINIKKPQQNISLDKESINKVNKFIQLINGKENNEKERVMLSLRWYYKHLDQQVEDAFLTLWIAIEILGDCDKSNIANIKKAFQQMYNMDSNKAGQTFSLGPIQSIRGNLVHRGKLKKIDGLFIQYLRRVYWDLLNHSLDQNCENYCLDFLNTYKFSVSNYI